MSDPYLWIKWLHILSATILFGSGLGTAFHMLMTHLRGNVAAIAVSTRNTVMADWLFTATSGVVQPVTGIVMVYMAGLDPFESWLVVTYGLYVVAGLCWLKVVQLQYRMRDLAADAETRGEPLPADYATAMRLWFILGWPAFVSLVAIFALMVMKPSLW